MALVYGLVRMIAVALTKMASWRHSRAMKNLEKADVKFRKIETLCKAEEVAVGRPVDYALQFKLMREYEHREQANDRWKRAASKMNKRKRVQTAISEFSGKKLPYSLGLLDMALVMKALEFAYARNFEWSQLSEMIGQYI